MTKIKVRHYVVKRGKGFWQPTKAMRLLGFYSVPCGDDGTDGFLVEALEAAVALHLEPSQAVLSLVAGVDAPRLSAGPAGGIEDTIIDPPPRAREAPRLGGCCHQ